MIQIEVRKMSIGSRIKEARIKQKMTQKDLGDLIGKSKSAVNNYENSVRGISSNLLIRIIKALNVDANYLFQDYFADDTLNLNDKAKKLYRDYMETDEYTQKSVDYILNKSKERIERQGATRLITRPLYFKVEEFAQDNRFASIGFSLPDTPNNRAGTALLMSFDDAMDPIYADNDCLLVRSCSSIDYDDIGIFRIGNKYMMRKMGINELLAANRKYKAIPLSSEIQCLAKVLRKIS